MLAAPQPPALGRSGRRARALLAPGAGRERRRYRRECWRAGCEGCSPQVVLDSRWLRFRAMQVWRSRQRQIWLYNVGGSFCMGREVLAQGRCLFLCVGVESCYPRGAAGSTSLVLQRCIGCGIICSWHSASFCCWMRAELLPMDASRSTCSYSFPPPPYHLVLVLRFLYPL